MPSSCRQSSPNFSTCSIVVSSRITSTASFSGEAVGCILCPVTSVYVASIRARASGMRSWMTDSLRCDISGTTYESCFSLKLCVSLEPTLQACICTDVMFPILMFLLLRPRLCCDGGPQQFGELPRSCRRREPHTPSGV